MYITKLRDLFKQAAGTHWIDDGMVQELANAVPGLCDKIEQLQAENSRLKEEIIAKHYAPREVSSYILLEEELKRVKAAYYATIRSCEHFIKDALEGD